MYCTIARIFSPEHGSDTEFCAKFQNNLTARMGDSRVSMSSFKISFKSVLQAQFIHPDDDVITWKYFPRYWPFVRRIHRSPLNSPHKGQWRGALLFSLICAWINDRVNNREAGDLTRRRAHYDVTVKLMVWERRPSATATFIMFMEGHYKTVPLGQGNKHIKQLVRSLISFENF